MRVFVGGCGWVGGCVGGFVGVWVWVWGCGGVCQCVCLLCRLRACFEIPEVGTIFVWVCLLCHLRACFEIPEVGTGRSICLSIYTAVRGGITMPMDAHPPTDRPLPPPPTGHNQTGLDGDLVAAVARLQDGRRHPLLGHPDAPPGDGRGVHHRGEAGPQDHTHPDVGAGAFIALGRYGVASMDVCGCPHAPIYHPPKTKQKNKKKQKSIGAADAPDGPHGDLPLCGPDAAGPPPGGE